MHRCHQDSYCWVIVENCFQKFILRRWGKFPTQGISSKVNQISFWFGQGTYSCSTMSFYWLATAGNTIKVLLALNVLVPWKSYSEFPFEYIQIKVILKVLKKWNKHDRSFSCNSIINHQSSPRLVNLYEEFWEKLHKTQSWEPMLAHAEGEM